MAILKHLVNEKQGIRENIEEQFFEFYVKGYTQTINKVNIQSNYALLFSDAAMIQKKVARHQIKQEYIYPFGTWQDSVTRIELVSERDNKKDPYAIQVIAHHPFNILDDNYKKFQHLLLGYVPQSISRIVFNSLDQVKDGIILKVCQIHGRKYYSAKVALRWKPAPRQEDIMMMDLLADLIEDIEEG